MDKFNSGSGKERRLAKSETIRHIRRLLGGSNYGVQYWLCTSDMSSADRAIVRQRSRLSRPQITEEKAVAAIAAIETAMNSNASGAVQLHNSAYPKKRSRTKCFCADCGGVLLCRKRPWIVSTDGVVERASQSCWNRFHTADIKERMSPVQPPQKQSIGEESEEDGLIGGTKNGCDRAEGGGV